MHSIVGNGWRKRLKAGFAGVGLLLLSGAGMAQGVDPEDDADVSDFCEATDSSLETVSSDEQVAEDENDETLDLDCVDPQDLQEDGDVDDDAIREDPSLTPAGYEWVVVDDDDTPDEISSIARSAEALRLTAAAPPRSPAGGGADFE